MFFWTEENETPLSEAVINNDLETVARLGHHPDHRKATNYLGFSAIELARYLDRQECLDILKPNRTHHFNVHQKNGEQKVMDLEEFEQFFQVHYISYLKFESYDLLKSVIKCAPWFYELPKMENEGAFSDVSIRWIDDELGYGLFTEKEIKKGEFVGEYCGLMRQVNRLNPQFNEYCYRYPSSFRVLFYFTIDSKHQGNELRFANHSYTPNLQPEVAIDRGLLHTVFAANKDILVGEQLTYDYGEDYWMRRGLPQDI